MNAKLLKELENLVEEHRQQITALQQELDGLETALAVARRKVDETDSADSGSPANRSKLIRNTMVDILKAHGAPMHYGDIHTALEAQGIKVPGQDPKKNVGAHLSNDERFQPIGAGRWQLKSWGTEPSPKANVVSWRDRVRDRPPLDPPYFDGAEDDEDERSQEIDPTAEDLSEIERGQANRIFGYVSR